MIDVLWGRLLGYNANLNTFEEIGAVLVMMGVLAIALFILLLALAFVIEICTDIWKNFLKNGAWKTPTKIILPPLVTAVILALLF